MESTLSMKSHVQEQTVSFTSKRSPSSTIHYYKKTSFARMNWINIIHAVNFLEKSDRCGSAALIIRPPSECPIKEIF